jgi:RNA polymerase sigma-70 factor (ECF subfamily)
MDRRTFETLVRAHQAQLYRYARYLGAAPGYCEDLVQETFLAALKSESVALAADSTSQGAYLRGILRNTFLAGCRKMKNLPIVVNSDYLEGAEAAWQAQFLRDGDGFDYVEALRQCLKVLDEKGRRFLDLFYGQGGSRQEVASEMHLTPDGVKTACRRLRARLGECVRRRLGLREAEGA